MALGKKTGGRQRGTPNKRTAVVQELLDRLGVEQIEGLARIGSDEKNPPELRAKVLAQACAVFAPAAEAN